MAASMFPAQMGPRWKGKGSKVKALADPMSKIVARLQSSLVQSETHGSFSGGVVRLVLDTESSKLLAHACFGHPDVTAEDKRWFQLSLEEAFYLHYSLRCLKVKGVGDCLMTDEEIWDCFKTKMPKFPLFYKAYSHLRSKNFVVRPGLAYGVDLLAYHHHPSLVHAEYAVIVLSGDDDGENNRLKEWSDIHGTVRLCGSVAKTLLVLYVNRNGHHDAGLSSCLAHYTVEEQIIRRWIPESCRGDRSQKTFENGSNQELKSHTQGGTGMKGSRTLQFAPNISK